jgi:hypothetical protein
MFFTNILFIVATVSALPGTNDSGCSGQQVSSCFDQSKFINCGWCKSDGRLYSGGSNGADNNKCKGTDYFFENDCKCPVSGCGSRPNKGNTWIQGITFSGSGCLPGTAQAVLADDLSSFTIIYDAFIASGGPRVKKIENLKACQVSVDIRYPKGWKYSFATVDVNGFADIPEGVQGIVATNVDFNDGSDTRTKVTLYGPFATNYKLGVDVSNQDYWSNCKGNWVQTRINTVIKVAGDLSKPAFITADKTVGKVKHTYWMNWNSC